MSGFDESVLADADRLAVLDRSRLLWSLATAGAQVRHTVETSAEAELGRLRSAGVPRALLVAGEPSVAALVTALAAPACAALPWTDADLPGWAGPLDALLVASVDGRDPRLAELTAQATRRGLSLVVVAPAGSPVAAAAFRSPVVAPGRDGHPLAARWTAVTAFLLALDALGVRPAPREQLHELADALDERAAACRPDADPFVNPAKALALELSAAVPVVVGAGPFAAVAAETFASSLATVAATPALTARLPDELPRATRALAAYASADRDADLFRDRVLEAEPRRAHLVVIGADGAAEDSLPAGQLRLVEGPARDAARRLQQVAAARGLRTLQVQVPHADEVTRYASATALGDFTAAYLGLALGVELEA